MWTFKKKEDNRRPLGSTDQRSYVDRDGVGRVLGLG